MERAQVLEYIREMAVRLEPRNQPYVDRLAGVDLAQFLRHASDGDVPVFVVAGNLSLRTMAVPEAAVSMGYLQAVMHAGMPGGAHAPGGVVWDGATSGPGGVPSEPIMCYRPLSGFGLETLELAISDDLERLDVLSKLVERGGPYCPVDSRGGAMVKVAVEEEITLGTVRRGLLASHLRMTHSALVRLIDVRHHNGCQRLTEQEDLLNFPAEEIFVRTGRFSDPECWGRAVQVLR